METPYLYDYEILLGEDIIYGYFALRTFTKEKDKDGIWRICLNHHPIFMEGVLDQGYWPDGLMTPPADAAYIYDIMGMKETGFHMIRKHIKIEPAVGLTRIGMLHIWLPYFRFYRSKAMTGIENCFRVRTRLDNVNGSRRC